jgi:hypothetical protein
VSFEDESDDSVNKDGNIGVGGVGGISKRESSVGGLSNISALISAASSASSLATNLSQISLGSIDDSGDDDDDEHRNQKGEFDNKLAINDVTNGGERADGKSTSSHNNAEIQNSASLSKSSKIPTSNSSSEIPQTNSISNGVDEHSKLKTKPASENSLNQNGDALSMSSANGDMTSGDSRETSQSPSSPPVFYLMGSDDDR